jgi:serine/threonine-protein kinase HipA
MVTTAEVHLWGELIGVALWNEQGGYASFQYTPEFINKGIEVSPILMPLSDRIYSFPELSSQTFLGMPGLLADALPDRFGRALLDQWLAMNNRTHANPVERLCYQGKRSMGALEFAPAQNRGFDETSVIEVASLVKVASDVLHDRAILQTNMGQPTEALMDILRVGTSAGGQRAKAVIAYNDETQEVRSGQLDAPEGFDYWLLKLDGVTNSQLGDPQHYGEIEYVYYLMAKVAGINMTECRLLHENNRAHFMTRRFDRVNGEKVHMQTLCGLTHSDYNVRNSCSYEQAFAYMRQLYLPYPQAEEFFRRMVFNVVACNQDDHTKNISFLMDQTGKWSLSPAYDMSWAYNSNGLWTQTHQMSIRGKQKDITREDLLEVARQMNIKHPNELIDQVVDAVSQWQQLAMQYPIPQDIIDHIQSTHQYL